MKNYMKYIITLLFLLLVLSITLFFVYKSTLLSYTDAYWEGRPVKWRYCIFNNNEIRVYDIKEKSSFVISEFIRHDDSIPLFTRRVLGANLRSYKLISLDDKPSFRHSSYTSEKFSFDDVIKELMMFDKNNDNVPLSVCLYGYSFTKTEIKQLTQFKFYSLVFIKCTIKDEVSQDLDLGSLSTDNLGILLCESPITFINLFSSMIPNLKEFTFTTDSPIELKQITQRFTSLEKLFIRRSIITNIKLSDFKELSQLQFLEISVIDDQTEIIIDSIDSFPELETFYTNIQLSDQDKETFNKANIKVCPLDR